MPKAILFDSTLCVGCRACEEGCAKRWEMPYDEALAKQEHLSERKLTAVITHGERFSRKLCMHCNEPSCVSVCPVGAFEKTKLGPVIYHGERCMGCRYCMVACPYQVPTYEWSKMLPLVKKCDMCYDRQKAGKLTACAEACPVGATISGERDALLQEARKRLAEKPKEYYQRIYGLTEAGGGSVFYLSAVPFEQIGLKTNLPAESLPVLTWRVLSHIPDVVTMGGVLLGGVWWITHRRDEVARAEGKSRKKKEVQE